jgi:hypothetical protein
MEQLTWCVLLSGMARPRAIAISSPFRLIDTAPCSTCFRRGCIWRLVQSKNSDAEQTTQWKDTYKDRCLPEARSLICYQYATTWINDENASALQKVLLPEKAHFRVKDSTFTRYTSHTSNSQTDQVKLLCYFARLEKFSHKRSRNWTHKAIPCRTLTCMHMPSLAFALRVAKQIQFG